MSPAIRAALRLVVLAGALVGAWLVISHVGSHRAYAAPTSAAPTAPHRSGPSPVCGAAAHRSDLVDDLMARTGLLVGPTSGGRQALLAPSADHPRPTARSARRAPTDRRTPRSARSARSAHCVGPRRLPPVLVDAARHVAADVAGREPDGARKGPVTDARGTTTASTGPACSATPRARPVPAGSVPDRFAPDRFAPDGSVPAGSWWSCPVLPVSDALVPGTDGPAPASTIPVPRSSSVPAPAPMSGTDPAGRGTEGGARPGPSAHPATVPATTAAATRTGGDRDAHPARGDDRYGSAHPSAVADAAGTTAGPESAGGGPGQPAPAPLPVRLPASGAMSGLVGVPGSASGSAGGVDTGPVGVVPTATWRPELGPGRVVAAGSAVLTGRTVRPDRRGG